MGELDRTEKIVGTILMIVAVLMIWMNAGSEERLQEQIEDGAMLLQTPSP